MNTKKLLISLENKNKNPHSIPSAVINTLHSLQNCTTYTDQPSSTRPSILATNIIKSHFQNGLFNEARKLFDEMPHRDVVVWTSMVSGYTTSGRYDHAWRVFLDMFRSNVRPNEYTLSSVLKGCKGMRDLSCGVMVHGVGVKLGFEGCGYVDNALLDMYATCCFGMEDACRVFEFIRERNAVSWTTLISGYTHKGDGYGGLLVFQRMIMEDAELNPHSISIAVRACTSVGQKRYGKLMHAAVVKHGFQSSLPVMNSILDMYCRCDCLPEARQCFNEMSERDLITWNTFISGYERPDSRESLHIFSKMESEGFSPNCFTLTSVVAACANLAVLKCGQQVHGIIIRIGLEGNVALANALVDMYAKCGDIADARTIFNGVTNKNLVSWTSMMMGYGSHGYGKEAVELFDDMIRSGVRPDRIVFMAVLSACSHAGLVDEGLRYFRLLVNHYRVTPDKEIYGCAVDLLGRAGRVEEAFQLVKSMPFKPDESIWGALLGACKAHKVPSLGKIVAQMALEFKPNMVGAYVMLAKIYSAEERWGEYAKVRKMMRRMGSRKETGRSWIEVRDQVYSFAVEDKIGSHIEQVYKALDLLVWHMKQAGYVPDFDRLLQDF